MGTGRLIGRAAVCLPLSLLVSSWLLLRAAHPAPGAQDRGYFWPSAVVVSTAATAFAVLQALSPRTLTVAVGLSALGSFAAFFAGGFLLGPL